jgi:hypothetical protein
MLLCSGVLWTLVDARFGVPNAKVSVGCMISCTVKFKIQDLPSSFKRSQFKCRKLVRPTDAVLRPGAAARRRGAADRAERVQWTQERALASEQRLFREKLHDLLPRRIAARRIDADHLGALPPPERLVAVVLQARSAPSLPPRSLRRSLGGRLAYAVPVLRAASRPLFPYWCRWGGRAVDGIR